MNSHTDFENVEIRGLDGEKSEIGNGVFALKDFKKRQVICELTGKPSSVRTIYSFQIGQNKHLDPDLIGKNLNHSCDPNGYLKLDEGRLFLLAKRGVKKGEHLSFDYATSEFETETSADCKCGSSNCRKQIQGFKHMSADWKKANRSYTLSHLLN